MVETAGLKDMYLHEDKGGMSASKLAYEILNQVVEIRMPKKWNAIS